MLRAALCPPTAAPDTPEPLRGAPRLRHPLAAVDSHHASRGAAPRREERQDAGAATHVQNPLPASKLRVQLQRPAVALCPRLRRAEFRVGREKGRARGSACGRAMCGRRGGPGQTAFPCGCRSRSTNRNSVRPPAPPTRLGAAAGGESGGARSHKKGGNPCPARVPSPPRARSGTLGARRPGSVLCNPALKLAVHLQPAWGALLPRCCCLRCAWLRAWRVFVRLGCHELQQLAGRTDCQPDQEVRWRTGRWGAGEPRLELELLVLQSQGAGVQRPCGGPQSADS